MASRNERRRKARQHARVTRVEREASHDDIVGAAVVRTAERVSKTAESRQPTVRPGGEWDPERTIPPPIPPEALWTIFEQNAVHSGAINAKVADSVGRGWKLTPEDDTEDGAGEDVDQVTRELTDLLRKVCSRLTFTQLCQQAVRELDAIGWADWEVLRDRDGDIESDIVGIVPAPAQYVRAVRGDDDVFCLKRGDKKVYFKRFGVADNVNFETGERGEGVPEDKRANELVHFSHYTPRSDRYGIPPWISAMPAIAEFAAIREFNVSFFESGGQADRHFHVTAKDEGVAEQLADKMTQSLEESRGLAHTTLVTYGDNETAVAVSSLAPKQPSNSGSSRESDYRGGKEDLKEEIRVAHQVPPGRLGIAAGGALAGNANDSMDDDYRYGVVEPLQEIVEAELHRSIFGEHGLADLLAGWEFEFEDKTEDATQDEHDRAIESVDRAVMSPNDAREAKGEDRVEDPAMDRYYLGNQPVSTDPAVTDVKQLLSELRDALAVAVQSPTRDGETDDDPEIETAPDQVVNSERRGVFRGWKTLGRS